jgi:PAS domain S-box-containing protein/putative nucleotidyltransferase with HDIG domain
VKDQERTKKQPTNELIKLRQRIAELEKSESKYKSTEERIKLLNSTLKAIRSATQLIVREKNKDILLQKTCDILTEARTYQAVWFGLLRDDRTFSTVKGSGFRKDISFFCKQVMDGNYSYCIKEAFSQKDLLMIVDKSRTCGDCYFKNACAGKEAAILRVEYNSRLFGLLAISLTPDSYIKAEDETLLKEIAGDLAYALHKLELEKAYKQVEEELRKERDFNKTLIQTSPVFFVAINAEGKTLMMNEMMLHTLGYTTEEVVGRDYLSTFVPEYDRKMLSKVFEKLIKKKKSTLNENHVVTKDGEELLVGWHGRSVFKANGDFDYFFGVGIDITERKRAEELFKKLFVHSPNAIFIIQDGKFKLVNPQFVKETGFSEEELLDIDSLELVHPEDKEMVRKNVIKNLKRELSSPFEFRGICKDGEIKWVLEVVTFITYQGRRAILGNFKDITEIRQVQKELQESYQKLQKTMEGTINTIAKIVETRDPYTAGHQLNVSKLTTAIAQEMKLPEDKIEGIRIASLVHDIGKISIPAEILSKPTKLNEIEYNLIKDHSQIGHDILKSIEFPWSIAEIVLQHHEKIDGSGYPHNLKGDKILLKAKIIGVADVVEAMSSHRPYRPALGIDKALEEISQNREILYDPEVVDICLKLFKEKGFKF